MVVTFTVGAMWIIISYCVYHDLFLLLGAALPLAMCIVSYLMLSRVNRNMMNETIFPFAKEHKKIWLDNIYIFIHDIAISQRDPICLVAYPMSTNLPVII